MNENSLLELLAKVCGDITINDNTDPDVVIQLQQAVASAIINEPGLSAANLFQFEEFNNFSTHHLNATDLEHLNKVLQNVQENQQAIDNTIRVFRREVPFLSSQVKRRVPEWAKGAGVIKSLGPFTSRDGRKYWFDLYRVIPLLQVWLEGAAQPFMLLPLAVRNLIIRRGPQSYPIPKRKRMATC